MKTEDVLTKLFEEKTTLENYASDWQNRYILSVNKFLRNGQGNALIE